MIILQKFKELIPPLLEEEFIQLEKNILVEGIREPLIVWNDILVDGHNRYLIAQKHNLEYKTIDKCFKNEDEVIDWMIANQLGRRNLTKETQSYLRGLQYEREKKKQGTNNQYVKSENGQNVRFQNTVSGKAQNELHQNTAEKLAEQYKVTEKTIRRDSEYTKAVDMIVSNTTPEVKHKILNREIDITKKEVEQISKLNPEKQKEIIEIAVDRNIPIKQATQEIKKEKLARDIETQIKTKEESISVDIYNCNKNYRIIYADPCWSYGDKCENGGVQSRGAENVYPTMSIREISELPIKEISEQNAVLFLWVTSPLLAECFEVIRSWGFKYKASFVWDKIKHNMGHYNSVRHEFLLICTKGSCVPDDLKLFDSVQSIERTEHSKKPKEFREIIEALYPIGNKIELFSRDIISGWDCWGNMV